MLKKSIWMLLLALSIASCSKNQKLDSDDQISIKELEKVDHYVTYIYQGTKYKTQVSEDGVLLPDEQSRALEKAVGTRETVSFSFSSQPEHHVFLFHSEMEGYKYMEKNDDRKLARQFQVSHATNLLRDQLINKYGIENLDFNNPQISQEAKAGVAAIYAEFKLKGEAPQNVEQFIGKLERKSAASAQAVQDRSNGLLRAWEHDDYLGAMFDIETAPNVWIWTHGDWNCYKTYAAADLNWNYKPDNTSWNDCISSAQFNFQAGADGVAYGFYKNPHYTINGCTHHILVVTRSEWQNGIVNGLIPRMRRPKWRGAFCGHMNDQISALRVQIVWQGCQFDFGDMY